MDADLAESSPRLRPGDVRTGGVFKSRVRVSTHDMHGVTVFEDYADWSNDRRLAMATERLARVTAGERTIRAELGAAAAAKDAAAAELGALLGGATGAMAQLARELRALRALEDGARGDVEEAAAEAAELSAARRQRRGSGGRMMGGTPPGGGSHHGGGDDAIRGGSRGGSARPSPSLAGVLFKQGYYWRQWKPRWCELGGGELRYFEDAAAAAAGRQLGAVALAGASVLHPMANRGLMSLSALTRPAAATFVIMAPERAWKFACDSPEECGRWVGALNAALAAGARRGPGTAATAAGGSAGSSDRARGGGGGGPPMSLAAAAAAACVGGPSRSPQKSPKVPPTSRPILVPVSGVASPERGAGGGTDDDLERAERVRDAAALRLQSALARREEFDELLRALRWMCAQAWAQAKELLPAALVGLAAAAPGEDDGGADGDAAAAAPAAVSSAIIAPVPAPARGFGARGGESEGTGKSVESGPGALVLAGSITSDGSGSASAQSSLPSRGGSAEPGLVTAGLAGGGFGAAALQAAMYSMTASSRSVGSIGTPSQLLYRIGAFSASPGVGGAAAGSPSAPGGGVGGGTRNRSRTTVPVSVAVRASEAIEPLRLPAPARSAARPPPSTTALAGLEALLAASPSGPAAAMAAAAAAAGGRQGPAGSGGMGSPPLQAVEGAPLSPRAAAWTIRCSSDAGASSAGAPGGDRASSVGGGDGDGARSVGSASASRNSGGGGRPGRSSRAAAHDAAAEFFGMTPPGASAARRRGGTGGPIVAPSAGGGGDGGTAASDALHAEASFASSATEVAFASPARRRATAGDGIGHDGAAAAAASARGGGDQWSGERARGRARGAPRCGVPRLTLAQGSKLLRRCDRGSLTSSLSCASGGSRPPRWRRRWTACCRCGAQRAWRYALPCCRRRGGLRLLLLHMPNARGRCPMTPRAAASETQEREGLRAHIKTLRVRGRARRDAQGPLALENRRARRRTPAWRAGL